MKQVAIPLQFDEAITVAELAKPIIAQYHTHLINARIGYIYKNKPMKKCGRTIFATVEKCSVKAKALCNISGGEAYDFVIVINYKDWNALTDEQRVAVLDHELCHCKIEEDEDTSEAKFVLEPHDISEFSGVLDRRGPDVFDDLRRFCELAKKKLDSKNEVVSSEDTVTDTEDEPEE